ncbi:MAG: helix-turn-helix domain-containing protein [Pseudomonadota bacterium]
MTNKHIGSSFDDFLQEEGLLEECTESAIKAVIAFQIKQIMEKDHLSKTAMADKMGTSRASLNRLLDPHNESVTLLTLKKAASIMGRKLKLELV